MQNLLILLLEIYFLMCHGYVFGWAVTLYLKGYLKTQPEKDVWIWYYIFAPFIAPFIYGVSLASSEGE